MLEPWIIEQIRRREQERRQDKMPQLEKPLPQDPYTSREDEEDPGIANPAEEKIERGVTIISI